LVDVITAMGRAALMDKLIFGGLGFIAAAVVVVFVLIRRRRRKNYEG
jgi:hypothetical protein